MTTPLPRQTDAAHELTSSLSALLLGVQRLRQLTGASDKERALALIDRLEGAIRGMTALLESLRSPPGAAGPDS